MGEGMILEHRLTIIRNNKIIKKIKIKKKKHIIPLPKAILDQKRENPFYEPLPACGRLTWWLHGTDDAIKKTFWVSLHFATVGMQKAITV